MSESPLLSTGWSQDRSTGHHKPSSANRKSHLDHMIEANASGARRAQI